MMTRLRDAACVSFALFAIAVLPGCGSSNTDNSASAGAGGQPPGGGSSGSTSVKGQACSRATRVGGFWVEATDSNTSVAGYVDDSVTPSFVWQESAREGDCAIVQRPNPFCEAGCSGEQVCSMSGTCVKGPRMRSVGSVTINGLSIGVTMTPDSSNGYWFLQTIPHPGFSAGTPISLTAAGADLGAFALNAQGVAALNVTTGSLVISRGAPLTLAWTAPPSPANGRIQITLNLSSHGTDSVALECNVADTGSFEIPASLITKLMNIELAGFPKLTVARLTADSASIAPGCVDLVVKATVIRDDVKLSGLTFCTMQGESTECPTGQTCLTNMLCGK